MYSSMTNCLMPASVWVCVYVAPAVVAQVYQISASIPPRAAWMLFSGCMNVCACVCSEHHVWCWADADVVTAVPLSVCFPHISSHECAFTWVCVGTTGLSSGLPVSVILAFYPPLGSLILLPDPQKHITPSSCHFFPLLLSYSCLFFLPVNFSLCLSLIFFLFWYPFNNVSSFFLRCSYPCPHHRFNLSSVFLFAMLKSSLPHSLLLQYQIQRANDEMKTGEGKLMKTRRAEKEGERQREKCWDTQMVDQRERRRGRGEIWGETLTVGEEKIKVFDRRGKKDSFSFVLEHHCHSNKDIALTEH